MAISEVANARRLRCAPLAPCARPSTPLIRSAARLSDRVSLRSLRIGPAPWGAPLVPSRSGLGDCPAGRLLDSMAFSAPGAGVARARPAALVVGHRVFEVALPGVPVAGRERAGLVADLDQVPQLVVGLVGVGLVAMVALVGGHGFQWHGELSAAGQGECPGGAPVRVARRWVRGRSGTRGARRGERPAVWGLDGRRGRPAGRSGVRRQQSP